MSDEVAKAVAAYEAAQKELFEGAEAQEVRALVQGMLAGSMMQQAAVGAMNIREVDIRQDVNGNYEKHFHVVTGSGIRVRVSVEVDGSSESTGT